MKFITSVSMPCTKEQYEADLKKPLEEMGYRLLSNSFAPWEDKNFQYIETLTGLNVCRNCNIDSAIGKDNYFIPTYNPEFFLALAAMTDEPRGITGEWFICIEHVITKADNFVLHYKSKLYKRLLRLSGRPIMMPNTVVLTCESDKLLGYAIGHYITPDYLQIHFRKATKEEIIKHFTNMEKKTEDLRELLQSGNIVEFSDGETGIVIDTPLGKFIQFGNLCGEVEALNEDLGYVNNPTLKIVRIRKINYPTQIISKYFHEAPIIWERKEVKEYTIEQLIEKAGFKKGEIKVKVEL